jgi:hypothetical protein
MTISSREQRREAAHAIYQHYIDIDKQLATEAVKEIDFEVAERLRKYEEENETINH